MTRSTALVTGAAGGLGIEFAKLLARDCATVVLVSRNAARLDALRQELTRTGSASLVIVAKDLSGPDAPQELVRELDSRGLAIDILINNAGFAGLSPFAQQDVRRIADMLAVNIMSLTMLTRLLLPGMIDRRFGRVLNISSTAAFQPGPFQAAYYASKSYVLSLSEALASELRGTGVTVTALCPGPTFTGFAATAGLERSRLFRILPVADAGDAARFGYQAMLQGKTVAVHGMVNRIMAFGTRFGPRRLTAAIARWLHGPF